MEQGILGDGLVGKVIAAQARKPKLGTPEPTLKNKNCKQEHAFMMSQLMMR